MNADALNAVTETVEVPIAQLIEFPRNARRGDVAMIADSLKVHGQYRALVVNTRTSHVVAGNHTLAALRLLGAETALVHYIDVDPAEEQQINLVDNHAPDSATYDEALLADVLQSLDGDFTGTGYKQSDLDALLGSLALDEPDDMNTGAQLGDVEYRILIDCRDERHQAELLGRFAADGLDAIAIAQ